MPSGRKEKVLLHYLQVDESPGVHGVLVCGDCAAQACMKRERQAGRSVEPLYIGLFGATSIRFGKWRWLDFEAKI